MHERATVHSFTVFADAEFDFVKGLNVYVGVNGSGKTHLLKLLYALQKHQFLVGDPARVESLDRTLVSVFKPDALGRLVRRTVGNQSCAVSATWNKKALDLALERRSKRVDCGKVWAVSSAPVMVPAKDILGHSIKFVEAYDNNWLDFDVTYRDLLVAAVPDVSRGPIPHEQKDLIDILRRQMTGRVEKSNVGRFYLKDSVGRIEFPLVAEGWRKLGLLWTLIRNGSLSQGNVLYWDEPEANLNPSMFPTLAQVLARLAATGTQIHAATHSYAMLRELEFASNEAGTDLRLFALRTTRTEGTMVTPCSRFVDLDPNPILDEYDSIYQRTVKAALGDG